MCRRFTLDTIREQLNSTFHEVFEEELPSYLKNKLWENTKEISSSSSSVALGVIGFFPIIGQVASGVGLVKESPNLLFNVGQTYKSARAVFNFQKYLEYKKRAMEKYINKVELSDKAAMIEMVDYLMSVISRKVTP